MGLLQIIGMIGSQVEHVQQQVLGMLVAGDHRRNVLNNCMFTSKYAANSSI